MKIESGVRVLSAEELEYISCSPADGYEGAIAGGWAHIAIGAVAGGVVSVGVGVSIGDTDLKSIGGNFITGAVMGGVAAALAPATAINIAATTIRSGQAGLVGGALYSGLTTSFKGGGSGDSKKTTEHVSNEVKPDEID